MAQGRVRGRPEDVKRNAGIARLLAEGRSWTYIQDMTGCSRAMVAKIAKRSPCMRDGQLKVWIYVDTSKQVGDHDHLKVFGKQEAAQAW
jgi:hypothetical protein